MEEVFGEFAEKFGRRKSMVEGYNMEDAEAVIVCLGSMAGTAKYISDKLRAEGTKVGVVKVVSFRPFPYRKLRSVIGDIKKVAVLDRTTGFGDRERLCGQRQSRLCRETVWSRITLRAWQAGISAWIP